MTSSERRASFGNATEVFRKALTSLLIGAIAYAITNLTHQPQIWAITLSIFIAGVVLVVQFLVTFEERLKETSSVVKQHSTTIDQRSEQQSDTIKRLVERRFSEIHTVSELFGLIEESVLSNDIVIELLRNAADIDPTSPLCHAFAEAEIRRMSQFLRELNQGDATYNGEDRDWLLTLARNAHSSIDATSLPAVDAGAKGWDDGFWESDLGNRYLEAQRDAVQRGVNIRRVFVAREEDTAAYRSFLRMCQRQIGLNIKVRVLSPDEIPQTLRNVMIDFILFDGIVSYEVTPAVTVGTNVHPAIVNTRVVLRPEKVRQNAEHFEELWSAARPVRVDSSPEAAAS
ncbi:MAG: hypothetical protein DLM59_14750 [Pseudonocardiales bacterium]|nr:MAG: hypothetical protein DLM59_14750 [Pseudonocardiales bacterium]